MKPIPVVVLQYGKQELTEKCLDTLEAQTVPMEIFLIDGASPHFSEEAWQRISKRVKWSRALSENVGYAGGNNVALQEIIAQYPAESAVLILNNDTELSPDCVEKMVDVLASNPAVGQVCPQVFYPNGLLQSAGGSIQKGLFEPRLIGNGESESSKYLTAQKVMFAPGMAVLVSLKALSEVGLIPEGYFLYAEDVDWSLRFEKKGWQVWYQPLAKVVHHESAGSGSFSFTKAYYLFRGNVLLAREWLSSTEYSQFKRAFMKKILKLSLKRINHPAFVWGIWRGWLDGVQGITGRRHG